MTLVFGAQDVIDLCKMDQLVNDLDAASREEAAGQVVMPPRTTLAMDAGGFRMMPVILNGSRLFGFKVFHWTSEGARYLVALYSQDNGELLALVDGDYMTAARTGAAAAVGARYMARADSTSCGVIGSGAEARTNLAAMLVVRPAIDTVKVFSPREARRNTFAAEIRDLYGIEAVACDAPDAAVKGVDIVITATNTGALPDPIAYRGAWGEPGQHISSIGSTMPRLRELDTDTFRKADILVVDAPLQMEGECGDVIAAIAEGVYNNPIAMDQVVAGHASGRDNDEQYTVLKSVGTGIQDVIAANVVYRNGLADGRGQEIDFLSLKSTR